MPLVEHADEADEFCHIGQGDGAQDAHVHSRVAIEDEILHLLADIFQTHYMYTYLLFKVCSDTGKYTHFDEHGTVTMGRYQNSRDSQCIRLSVYESVCSKWDAQNGVEL